MPAPAVMPSVMTAMVPGSPMPPAVTAASRKISGLARAMVGAVSAPTIERLARSLRSKSLSEVKAASVLMLLAPVRLTWLAVPPAVSSVAAVTAPAPA